MTLVLGLMNSRQAVLVSDRRYTVDGQLLDIDDEEKNKATVLFCQDARVVVGFTGIARAGAFETSRKVVSALLRAGQPDHLLLPMIGRFTVMMTEELEKLNIAARDNRLTVVFIGYRLVGPQPQPILCKVTNNVDKTGAFQKDAAHKFLTWHARNPLGLWGFGMCAGVAIADRTVLRRLLTEERPATALVDKAVDAIRNASESRSSKALVGKQCNSIILPADTRIGASVDYHSSSVKNKTYLPSAVVSTTRASFSSQGGSIEQWDSAGIPHPLVIPKVGRNEPCPCGSGEKFKRCHGRKARPRL